MLTLVPERGTNRLNPLFQEQQKENRHELNLKSRTSKTPLTKSKRNEKEKKTKRRNHKKK